MKKEEIASALFGGVSAFVLFLAFSKQGPTSPHAILLVLACCSEGISLALAPEVLFEQVTLKQLFNGEGSIRYGVAALFSVIAKLFFISAAVFWGLSYVTS